MKIENTRPLSAPNAGAAASRGGDAGFVVSTPASGQTSAARPAAPLLPAHAVLALQSLDEAPQKRARQVRRGHDSLDALARLKLGLLEGAAPGEVRATLQQLFSQREDSGDASLDAIVSDIDVRVAVELAKLERV